MGVKIFVGFGSNPFIPATDFKYLKSEFNNNEIMTTLEEKLLQLAKENFSELQVNAIKEMLEENSMQKKTIDSLQSRIANLENINKNISEELKTANEELSRFNKLFDDLQEREEKCLQIELECEKRNRNWDKELLKKEVSCLKAIAQNQSDLISDVFHSPVYRSYVDGHHTIIKKDGYGNSQQENLPYHQIVEQRVEATHHHDVLPGPNNPNVGRTSQDKV